MDGILLLHLKCLLLPSTNPKLLLNLAQNDYQLFLEMFKYKPRITSNMVNSFGRSFELVKESFRLLLLDKELLLFPLLSGFFAVLILFTFVFPLFFVGTLFSRSTAGLGVLLSRFFFFFFSPWPGGLFFSFFFFFFFLHFFLLSFFLKKCVKKKKKKKKGKKPQPRS